ncbi:hypothetical protein CR532_01900 [Candidatus Borreliella tachyglossi]|uniref:P31-23 n=1 Tax=Candidatus Borreliella tachyglossi TaxID=1964448 RepID=A0A2S1LWW6_9SPIR|nr:hypothetical protein [Candidatus Borreliella tachyglossi]AWG42755.1 hypothetical protein CR532_01900 [Candidatus Borreliella tachyglossi]
MIDRILLIFNIMFFGCFIYLLEILKFSSVIDFLHLHAHIILTFIFFVFVFNIFYSRFLYSRLYFVLNGVEDTYIFLKLKLMRKRLKSVFDISVLLKIVLLKQDKKSLDEIYFYLKDNKISNKTIVELYSVLISFREKEKAASLIFKYTNSKNMWLRYCVALSMISFKEYEKLSREIDYLKGYFSRDPIYKMYYYYLLQRSNLDSHLIEQTRLDIRSQYFKHKNRLNIKHVKLLNSNLFFVVFYYIYDSSRKDIFC